MRKLTSLVASSLPCLVAWSPVLSALVLMAWLMFGCVQDARANAPTPVYGTNGGALVGNAIKSSAPSDFSRLIAGTTPVGNVNVTDGIKVGVGRASPTMSLTRTIPWGAVARGASRALPLIGTALVIADEFDKLRCRKTTGGVGAECDAGQAPIAGGTVTGVKVQDLGGSASADRDTACAYALAQQPLLGAYRDYYNPDPPYNFSSGSPTSGQCALRYCTGPGPTGCTQYPTYPRPFEAASYTVADSCAGSVPVGSDGKCPTGSYSPANEDTLQGKLETWGDKSRAVGLVTDAMGKGVDLQPLALSPGVLSGPSTAAEPGTVTTTTGPGGTTTTTTTTNNNITYEDNRYTYAPTTVTVSGDTTTTTEREAPEIDTCGLPGKPACKIDESGTPEPGTKDVQGDVDGKLDETREAIANPEGFFGAFPEITWSFALPSTCDVIAIPAFAPWLEEINVCAFQGIFHEIMTVVWMLGGLFGAIGIFWRDQLSTP